MTPGHLLRLLLRHFSQLALLAAAGGVLAQADPPGRVGRLNHADGSVIFSPAGDNEWTDAEANRPLTRGDRLWTDRGSRAEIQIGSSAIRMDGQSRLEILALDDQSTRLSLTQGSVSVRVRSLPEGENFEIDTPNLAHRVVSPGDYRLDVDSGGTTRVTIHSGTGAVYGENGEDQLLGGGQQVIFHGRALAQLTSHESPPEDAFDRWTAERNRAEDQSIAARYVPREVVGYQQLDPHGQWVLDATRGAIWVPQGTPDNWAPYRDGHWEWIAPWGWTWIDAASWGFAPFHYGRWDLVDGRWAWVPGRLSLRTVYAPALVAFIDGAHGMLSGVSARTRIAWFPLAPGEMWQPGFNASMTYIRNVNPNMVPAENGAAYAYQHRREALTAMSGDDFHRGRPIAASWLQVVSLALTKAAIVPPPPMPQGKVVAARDRPQTVRSTPPAPPAGQVIANATSTGSGSAGLTSRTASAAASAPAAAPPPRTGPRARVAPAREVAPLASPVAQSGSRNAPIRERATVRQASVRPAAPRREPLPRSVQPRTREVVAAHAVDARRERSSHARSQTLPARSEQAKRDQLARREQQSRLAEQARRADRMHRLAQTQREARARKDERVRREAHASQLARTRRAADHDAQVLREQRIRRDEQAQREALLRDPSRRDTAAFEQQQQQRDRRTRPDLRSQPPDDPRARPPEVWQRGIPIPNLGPTS